MQKLLLTSASLLTLAACGGGSTGGGTDANGIATSPISGPEIEQLFTDVASISGAGFSEALLDLEGSSDEDFLADVTPRDLTAPGSASYQGVVVMADLDTSELFDPDSLDAELISLDDEVQLPTFLMLGRSQFNVTFGNTPSVSGGANGFIGVNFETLANVDPETIDLSGEPDVAAIIDALPTVDVDGSLTYAGGSIIDMDPEFDATDDLALGFDVTGSMTLPNALTGTGTATVDIDGRGLGAAADNFAIGLIDASSEGQTLGGIVIGIDD